MMSQKKNNVVVIISILLSLLAGNLLAMDTVVASGVTLYVDDSNTGGPWNGTQEHPYRTIHDALAAASNGDSIFVYSGTYLEKIEITIDVTIQGENKDTTFIDGGGSGHVINAHGTYGGEILVTLKYLTIRNAGGSGFDCVTYSYVTGGEISNNKILNSQEGEGISLDHCQGVTIQGNTLTNNKVTAVSVTASEQTIIDQNMIQSNQKGIHLASFSTNNQITGNTIRDNTVYGVYVVQSSSNIFSRNEFIDNSQNAQDQSTNSWSQDNQGNYWDDYNNYDNNSDGIGDSPYSIPGGSNVDNYPLGYFKQPEIPGDQNQLPTAVSISISNTSALQNTTIFFSGEGIDSDGYIDGYQWRSSIDGILSYQQTFSSASLSVGTHTIYFKVMDNDGAWSSEKSATLIIDSSMNQAPLASIDKISPNPAIQGEPVTFRGHGSDEEGIITAYKWISSKDGALGTTSSIILSNLSVGVHTIYFQVKDAVEWSTQVVSSVTIQRNASANPENQAPHAYPGGPYLGKVNQAISFNGSLSYDDNGTLTGFWNFGDNTTGNGLALSHTYTSPGTYMVSFTVTDEEGLSSTAITSAVITQSGSESDSLGGFSIADFEVPFPVLMVLVVLVIVGIIIGFIYKISQR